MNRSIWKIPPVLLPKENSIPLFGQSKEQSSDPKINKPLITYLRAAVIGPDIIGTTVQIHNGQRFVPIRITENHVGFKLGQFVLTKKRVFHKRKKKKK